MNKKMSVLFSAMFLSACAQNTTPTSESPSTQTSSIESRVSQSTDFQHDISQNDTVVSIMTTPTTLLWSQNFDHHQTGLLKDVAHAIHYYAQQGNVNAQALDNLTYYLRIYSSFGPDKDWPKETAKAVNDALIALQAMPDFYKITPTTARLHENYAVALYRLYFLEPLQKSTEDHVKPLAKLIDLYGSTTLSPELENNLAIDYALWEVIRAAAILPYEARRKNKPEHIQAVLGQDELSTSLLTFLTSTNAIKNGKNWPKQHATWALANYYNLYNKQYWNAYYEMPEEDQKKLDDDKMSLPFEKQMDDLDNAVWQALASDKALSNDEVKTLFSVPYVVTTYRGKSECSEDTLEGRCIAPTIKQALPIEHICSDSLYILTQKMTKAQLEDSCQQLTSQEADFHTKLATNNQAVANDFNDKLRVIIFNNAAEYNKYGQLVFDIHTDNGGMYIEGTPQNPDNIATFYSYEHFWIRPEFKVWNLNHEYVHYLDGRFIKYDTFNHFPSHMVWWSEGLAEYISKGDKNPKAFKELTKIKSDKWPTLAEVFATEYKDGTDRVYKWGYLAVRYMAENHKEQYHQLAHFLKTDYFDGYKELLEQAGETHKEDFTLWLVKHTPTEKTAENNDENKVDSKNNDDKPRQFYRYTYKDYLQPKHLVEDEKHMVWQYWHANSEKTK
jgi:microbial collagenase